MRTKTINIYTFSELSKEAKEKAIEQYRDLKNQSWDMLAFFSDDVVDQLKEKGWQDVKLQYSLSCCQGDGLSFSGKLDLKYFLDKVYSVKLPNRKKLAICEYIYSVISKGNTGHYQYAHKNDIDYTENYQDGIERKHIDKLWQNILEEIKDYYMLLCKQFEKQGYDEIDFQLSDECIIEDIQVNELEFNDEGKRNISI
jgi:hypothetical protein